MIEFTEMFTENLSVALAALRTSVTEPQKQEWECQQQPLNSFAGTVTQWHPCGRVLLPGTGAEAFRGGDLWGVCSCLELCVHSKPTWDPHFFSFFLGLPKISVVLALLHTPCHDVLATGESGKPTSQGVSL